MRLLLPLLLLLAPAAGSASAQDPVLEPAFTPPGDTTPGDAGGAQLEPYIAAGGPGALAVWVDHRAEFTVPLANQGGPDVFAMRLDPNGAPLDPVAIRMPPQVGDKQFAKAAWNGSTWLVTWENQQPLGTSSFFRLILGARVAADGTLLDTTPIVIKNDNYSTGSTTAVASDGNGWVVVVQGTEASGGRIVGVRVAADGTVLNPGGSQLLDSSSAIFLPDLEYANGTYLLVWASGSIQGLRFDQALVPLGSNFTIGTGSSAMPRVGTDGQDFLVAWENSDLGTNVRARRVTNAGGLGTIHQVSPFSNGEYNWEPDVTWSGGVWHVSFTDTDDDVYRIARISAGNELIDFGGVAMPFGPPASQGRMVVAGLGSSVVAAYETEDLSLPWPGEILSAAVSDALVAGASSTLSLSASRQGFPDIAAGDAQYGLALFAEEAGTSRIEFQRFDAFGAALDAEPIELASGDRLGKPSVAWNGAVYLVAWEDLVVPSFETDDVVYATRVGADGTVLDPAPFPVMGGSVPDVAAQPGGDFLVVSSHAPSTSQLRYTFGRRVAADGSLPSPAAQIGTSFARWPAAAPYQGGWLVAWRRYLSHDNPNSNVHAAVVAADGTPGSSFLAGGAGTPDVASRGTDALIVWQDAALGVGARFFDDAGTLSGTFSVANSPAAPGGPSVAWNGEEYVVVWDDFRNFIGLWDYRTDVYATRVSAAGVVLDPGGGFAVASGPETEHQAVVAGALGTTMFAFDELVLDPALATLRVRLRRESPWATQLGGVGGPAGAPTLQGQGDLVPSSTVSFHLSGAAPTAPTALVVGFSAVSTPFFGGVLVPSPDYVLPFTSDASGAFSLSLGVPPGLLPGTVIHAQEWLLDPAAPQAVAGTNAVVSTAP